MKPHLWLSSLATKKGQWACCTAETTDPYTPYGRVIRPVGVASVFYGATPKAAYNEWRDNHVGSA